MIHFRPRLTCLPSQEALSALQRLKSVNYALNKFRSLQTSEAAHHGNPY